MSFTEKKKKLISRIPMGDNINLERSYIKHTWTYAARVWHMELRVKGSNWRKYAYLKFLNTQDNIQLKVDWTLHKPNYNNELENVQD